MSEDKRKIFIEGIPVDSIKDDQKLATFLEEFSDNIIRVADKKFAQLCKKSDVKCSLTVVLTFEEKK